MVSKELIFREDLLEAYDRVHIGPPGGARKLMVDAPTVDAVEVPCRCKDCKHWKHFDHVGCSDLAKVCTLANYMIGANGYCLYGERREGE